MSVFGISLSNINGVKHCVLLKERMEQSTEVLLVSLLVVFESCIAGQSERFVIYMYCMPFFYYYVFSPESQSPKPSLERRCNAAGLPVAIPAKVLKTMDKYWNAKIIVTKSLNTPNPISREYVP